MFVGCARTNDCKADLRVHQVVQPAMSLEDQLQQGHLDMAVVLQPLETRQAWKLTARFVITLEPRLAQIAWTVGLSGADSHPYWRFFDN